MREFAQLLGKCVVQYGGEKQDLARVIGVTPSAFSRLLKATTTPTIETCLRLAHVTGVSASKCLRAGGHAPIADLMEDLYGAPAERRLNATRIAPVEEQYLAHWRSLSTADRKAFAKILASLSAALGAIATNDAKHIA